MVVYATKYRYWEWSASRPKNVSNDVCKSRLSKETAAWVSKELNI